MTSYEEKALYLIAHYRKCKVCSGMVTSYNCTLHHQMHNTTGNRRRYPLAIDSLYNLLPIHPGCIMNDNQFTISDQALSRYEILLIAFKAVINDGIADNEIIYKDLRQIADSMK